MRCERCGKYVKTLYNKLCQGCYRYFKSGGLVYDLPPKGVILFDNEGKCICHICWRSYKRIGSHAKESHNMSIEEYKEKFGICRRSKTTQKDYSNIMREHAFKNKMDENLLVWGMSTRIKSGETDKRKGKEVRQQEIIEKRKRKIRKNK